MKMVHSLYLQDHGYGLSDWEAPQIYVSRIDEMKKAAFVIVELQPSYGPRKVLPSFRSLDF